MKMKRPRTGARTKTGGIKTTGSQKHSSMPSAVGGAKSRTAHHTGGVMAPGPEGPKGTRSRAGKHTGGIKKKSVRPHKMQSREKFIEKAEDALGDTEF